MQQQSFATRLNKALKNAGKTPAQLAREIEMTRAGMWLWLNGRCKQPRNEQLTGAANALNVSPGWLMFGEKQKGTLPMVKTETQLRLDRLARFLQAWQNLTVQQQQQFVAMIEDTARRNGNGKKRKNPKPTKGPTK